MPVYIISYELTNQQRNYDDLYSAIQGIGNHIHPLKSTWFVHTEPIIDEELIAATLKAYLDVNDKLIVMKASPSADGWHDKYVWKWLDNHVR